MRLLRRTGIALLGLLLCLGSGSAGELDHPFFAMDTGTHNGFSAEKIAMLAEVGYRGVDFSALEFFQRSVDQIPEVLAAVDAHGLTLHGVYLDVFIDDGTCPAHVRRAIEMLAGRDETVIWSALRSADHEPGSVAGDEAAVATVRCIADLAAEAGLQVVLYPHTDFYAERVADNVRLAEKVDRENVGVTWNLCHWLKVEKGREFEKTAAQALPYLRRVTINGADEPEGDMGWDRLIQPLDSGSYDVAVFLKGLRDLGYRGPVGLQGYGIGGDRRAVLERSLAAWKDLARRIEGE